MRTRDTEILRRAIKDHGFWVKKAAKGPTSLIRAVSNALYFTDDFHSKLQKMVVDKFRQEIETVDHL
jgi:hypothetical protein